MIFVVVDYPLEIWNVSGAWRMDTLLLGKVNIDFKQSQTKGLSQRCLEAFP